MLFALPTGTTVASPEIPGATQATPIALVNATIHPVSSPVIERGTVVFEGGRITGLGANVTVPPNARRVDVSGKHVYPSLLDAWTNIGLVEINAVRATLDQSESGRINPNVRAQVAVNPDSELIPVTRSNGVLLALTAPRGGLISGRSAVLQLDGWTWEDMTLKADVGLHIDWPRMTPGRSPRNPEIEGRGAPTDDPTAELQRVMADVQAYRKARSAAPGRHPIDIRWEAMLPVLEGHLPLIVEADREPSIQAAVAFAVQHGAKLVIYGGYDAPLCSDLLKQHDVPVIVGGVHRLPQRRWEDYDTPFTVAARLAKSGVRFCISGAGRFGASNVRNLPYHAGTAIAYGLPPEEALKAVTLYPAQILGVADRVGSLEVGKDATLFVSDGDPLETATQIQAAYIQGRAVDLSDKHKRLWAKYREKYRRLDRGPEQPATEQ